MQTMKKSHAELRPSQKQKPNARSSKPEAGSQTKLEVKLCQNEKPGAKSQKPEVKASQQKMGNLSQTLAPNSHG